MNVTRAYPAESLVYFRVRPCGYTSPRRAWNRTRPQRVRIEYALPNSSHRLVQPQATAALQWMRSRLSFRAITFVACNLQFEINQVNALSCPCHRSTLSAEPFVVVAFTPLPLPASMIRVTHCATLYWRKQEKRRHPHSSALTHFAFLFRSLKITADELREGSQVLWLEKQRASTPSYVAPHPNESTIEIERGGVTCRAKYLTPPARKRFEDLPSWDCESPESKASKRPELFVQPFANRYQAAFAGDYSVLTDRHNRGLKSTRPQIWKGTHSRHSHLHVIGRILYLKHSHTLDWTGQGDCYARELLGYWKDGHKHLTAKAFSLGLVYCSSTPFLAIRARSSKSNTSNTSSN